MADLFTVWDVFWACVVTAVGTSLAWLAPKMWKRRRRPTAPRVQCSLPVYDRLSLGPPERCAFEEGHDGECEP